ncbi:MAG TPA: VOC family protein [Calditrichia bacterium]|nr:VOC family protein [Calditrichota bacterium]HQV30413.1 VOC family protein [Calditrichia bacterium]
MSKYIGAVTFVVRDYDEAIAYFRDKLFFELREDTPLEPGKRWVLVAPQGGGQNALLLAKAATESQVAAVGKQTGGRVAFFLHTDSFYRDYERMSSAGVNFLEKPRHESYGIVAVFEDLYGNKWDLVEKKDEDVR